MEKELRLDKYLADMKVGSRSEVKIYIRKCRVTVNGEVVRDVGFKVKTTDCVEFDGQPIGYAGTEYYMLNKPAGVLTATMDKHQSTVLDLLADAKRKDLFPVGRLDKDTEGLLLLTNDGKLAHALLSPKKHVDKVYYAKIDAPVTQEDVLQFAAGLKVDETLTAMPAELRILHSGEISEIELTIQEGKFHQVKRMFEAVGKQVLYLKRLSMGPLVLDETLQPGEYLSQTFVEHQLGIVVIRRFIAIDKDQPFAPIITDQTRSRVHRQTGTGHDQQVRIHNGADTLLNGLIVKALFI